MKSDKNKSQTGKQPKPTAASKGGDNVDDWKAARQRYWIKW
jgi:hypothetical protein